MEISWNFVSPKKWEPWIFTQGLGIKLKKFNIRV